MRYLTFIIVAVTCVSLFSCDDDVNTSDQPIFLFSDKFYSFKPSEDEITRTLDLGIAPGMATRSGNELYIHSSWYARYPDPPYPHLSLSLVVVDLPTFSVKTSRQFSPPTGEASAITVSDKLYIYDYDYAKGGAFISTFNADNLEPGDSAFTNTDYYIQDLLAVEGKVFLSLGREIRVFDANTFDEIKTIDISSPIFTSDHSKFILDKDKNILIYNGGVRKLSLRDLSISGLRKHDSDIYGDMIRPAYNANEEVLYIVHETRPAPVYNLVHEIRRFNLVTMTEESFLANPDDVRFTIAFIHYSPDNQLVIIGGGVGPTGIVKTFDTKGVLQKEYTLPVGVRAAY